MHISMLARHTANTSIMHQHRRWSTRASTLPDGALLWTQHLLAWEDSRAPLCDTLLILLSSHASRAVQGLTRRKSRVDTWHMHQYGHWNTKTHHLLAWENSRGWQGLTRSTEPH